jgi:phage baseplate assembly protein W
MKFYPFNEAKSTRVYRDLNLNLSQNPITNDVTSVTDVNAVKRSINNLLNTNHYDRPFHPEIGSAIQHLLFEDYGPITANRMKRAIEEVIGNFEPRARITQVDCNPMEDGNDYDIIIHFYVENLPTELQSLQTVLETVR